MASVNTMGWEDYQNEFIWLKKESENV